jgi:hypothetical protein
MLEELANTSSYNASPSDFMLLRMEPPTFIAALPRSARETLVGFMAV